MSRLTKRRSLRPMLEACEARLLMSADATMKIPGTVSALVAASTSQPSAGTFEPLAFQATYVDQDGLHDSLDGTLQLHANEKTGRLTGELADDVRGSIAVQGQIRGGTLNLTFNLGDGTKLSGSGPVIQDHLHSGFWTLESVGSVGIVGQGTSGLWEIRGAHAVTTTSQTSAASQVTAVPAGTRLAPTAFTVQFVRGPDAGQVRSGVLDLGKVGSNGRLTGQLVTTSQGDIPVTGRLLQGRIQLQFNLGVGGRLTATGNYTEAEQGLLLAVGLVSGPKSGDLGELDRETADYYGYGTLFSYPPESIQTGQGHLHRGPSSSRNRPRSHLQPARGRRPEWGHLRREPHRH